MATLPSDIRIEPLQESDTDSVLALFEACYGRGSDRSPTPPEWMWRGRRPGSDSHAWIAKIGDQTVGLRPAVVCDVSIDGQRHRAAHFRDAMTHPGYRRRGVFSALMTTASESLSNAALFAYCFPNDNSLRAYRNLPAWKCVIDVPLFLYAVRRVPVRTLRESFGYKALFLAPLFGLATAVARIHRSGVARTGARNVQLIERLDPRFSDLWNRAGGRFGVAFPRTVEYLTWRYLDRPAAAYTIHAAESEGSENLAGYVVTRSREMFGLRLGLIVDCLFDPDDPAVAATLFDAAARYLLARQADVVACQFVGPPSVRDGLRRAGFVRVPRVFLPRRFPLYIRNFTVRPDLWPLLSKPDSWYLTWGDNDAV